MPDQSSYHSVTSCMVFADWQARPCHQRSDSGRIRCFWRRLGRQSPLQHVRMRPSGFKHLYWDALCLHTMSPRTDAASLVSERMCLCAGTLAQAKVINRRQTGGWLKLEVIRVYGSRTSIQQLTSLIQAPLHQFHCLALGRSWYQAW